MHQIPTNAKQRAQFHKEVTPVLLTDPSFRTLHEQFHTKIDLAIDLIESAIRHRLPFSVLSYQNVERTGAYAVLVTNRVDWSARQLIGTYLRRWPIKTFYQDGKAHLGLDESLMRNAKSIENIGVWCS